MSTEFYAKIKEEGQTCLCPSLHGCRLPISKKGKQMQLDELQKSKKKNKWKRALAIFQKEWNENYE